MLSLSFPAPSRTWKPGNIERWTVMAQKSTYTPDWNVDFEAFFAEFVQSVNRMLWFKRIDCLEPFVAKGQLTTRWDAFLGVLNCFFRKHPDAESEYQKVADLEFLMNLKRYEIFMWEWDDVEEILNNAFVEKPFPFAEMKKSKKPETVIGVYIKKVFDEFLPRALAFVANGDKYAPFTKLAPKPYLRVLTFEGKGHVFVQDMKTVLMLLGTPTGRTRSMPETSRLKYQHYFPVEKVAFALGLYGHSIDNVELVNTPLFEVVPGLHGTTIGPDHRNYESVVETVFRAAYLYKDCKTDYERSNTAVSYSAQFLMRQPLPYMYKSCPIYSYDDMNHRTLSYDSIMNSYSKLVPDSFNRKKEAMKASIEKAGVLGPLRAPQKIRVDAIKKVPESIRAAFLELLLRYKYFAEILHDSGFCEKGNYCFAEMFEVDEHNICGLPDATLEDAIKFSISEDYLDVPADGFATRAPLSIRSLKTSIKYKQPEFVDKLPPMSVLMKEGRKYLNFGKKKNKEEGEQEQVELVEEEIIEQEEDGKISRSIQTDPRMFEENDNESRPPSLGTSSGFSSSENLKIANAAELLATPSEPAGSGLADINAMELRINCAEELITAFRKKSSHMEKTKEDLKARCERVTQEHKKAAKEHEEFKKAAKKTEDQLKADIKRLTAEKRRLEDENIKLKTEKAYNNQDSKIAELKSKVKQAEKEKEDANKRARAEAARSEELVKRLAKMELKLLNAEETVDTLIEKYEELEMENIGLAGQVDPLKQKLKKSVSHSDTVEETVSQLEEQLAKKEKTVVELTEKCETMQKTLERETKIGELVTQNAPFTTSHLSNQLRTLYELHDKAVEDGKRFAAAERFLLEDVKLQKAFNNKCRAEAYQQLIRAEKERKEAIERIEQRTTEIARNGWHMLTPWDRGLIFWPEPLPIHLEPLFNVYLASLKQ